jgi:prepilin-type N-terminal cleavage/methylation domain-containing protein
MFDHRRGFTILEFAVVLTIVGFLIAAVLAGNSLIEEAKLKAVITESSELINAIDLFEKKYSSLPGDTVRAYEIWGTNCAETAVECNGNGNGIIEYSAGTTTVESFHAWQHLSLANMVNGSYSGVATVSGQADIAINIPRSSYDSAGWSLGNNGTYSPPNTEGQFLQIGGFTSGDLASSYIFKPESLYSIDRKVDDGKPRSGLIMALGAASECFDEISLGGVYNIAKTDKLCAARFIIKK